MLLLTIKHGLEKIKSSQKYGEEQRLPFLKKLLCDFWLQTAASLKALKFCTVDHSIVLTQNELFQISCSKYPAQGIWENTKVVPKLCLLKDAKNISRINFHSNSLSSRFFNVKQMYFFFLNFWIFLLYIEITLSNVKIRFLWKNWIIVLKVGQNNINYS